MSSRHSRLLVWGAFGGLRSTRPTDLILDLPPSDTGAPWQFSAVAAGSKHLALLSNTGQFVLVGNNKHGQVGQPVATTSTGSSIGSSAAVDPNEYVPYLYDLDFHPSEVPNAVSCGVNYSIFYRRGSRHAVVMGKNLYGQLGLGHKQILDNAKGFAEWSPDAPWFTAFDDKKITVPVRKSSKTDDEKASAAALPEEGSVGSTDVDAPATSATAPPEGGNGSGAEESAAPVATRPVGIKKIACGHGHTIILMENGSVLTCGTNTWGELGLGHSDSPMRPTLVEFFEEKGIKIVDVEAGSCWSLYLGSDGRVWCNGANHLGQLTIHRQNTPTTFPLTRLGSNKLLKARFATCGSDHAFFVTKSNEVYMKGSLTDVGVHCEAVLHEIEVPEEVKAAGGIYYAKSAFGNSFAIDGNGSIYGYGVNAEGQVHIGSGKVNLAPTRYVNKLKHVLDPLNVETFHQGVGKTRKELKRYYRDAFAVSHGFCVLSDPDELYQTPPAPTGDPKPVYLPPLREKPSARRGRKLKF